MTGKTGGEFPGRVEEFFALVRITGQTQDGRGIVAMEAWPLGGTAEALEKGADLGPVRGEAGGDGAALVGFG